MGGRCEQTTCTVQCAAGPDCRARDQTVCGTHLNAHVTDSITTGWVGHTQYNQQPDGRRDGLDTHSTTSSSGRTTDGHAHTTSSYRRIPH